MRRGSITVFLALVLVLILSFVSAMLEGARVSALEGKAQWLADSCTQSVFAGYSKKLWEDYHVLGLYAGDAKGAFSLEALEGKAMSLAEENLDSPQVSGWELLGLECQSVAASQYLLATDGAGEAFLQGVARQMKLEGVANVLEQLSQRQQDSSQLLEKSQEQEDQWQDAWDALDQAEEMAEDEAAQEEEENQDVEAEDSSGDEEDSQEQEEVQENPMEYVKELKRSTLLSLVMPQAKELSGKALLQGQLLGQRSLSQGNMELPKGTTGQELLLGYYIQQYFSCFTGTSPKGPSSRALDYEMEYLVAKKSSDGENLEKVVEELLAMRQVCNTTTLMGDAAKKQEARSLALALVGFTGMVPLILAVQVGILLAWAFVESVLDVRALLGGGKVPLIKTADQWGSGLSSLRSHVEEGDKSQEESRGLTYSQYLAVLLFLQEAKGLALGCMELIEQNEQLPMDAVVFGANVEYCYTAKPLFWSVMFLPAQALGQLHFAGTTEFSYMD